MAIRLPALLPLLLVACHQLPAPASKRPNVVFIISDDQAFGDFGFMGHEVIETPNLDRLAARSAVFGNGYVPSSLCRPSLATMITGLYPHQHKITGNDPPRGVGRERMLAHIAAVKTLPTMLAEAGYRSLQTGKWWEGNCRCGGFTSGMTHGDPTRGGRHGDDGLQIGRKTMQPIHDFLDDCGEEPFFLWYAPFLPHAPHNPPERLLARYRQPGRSIHIARYFAMCTWFDETCGQILDDLERRGLSNDTLVVFAVDNGWIQNEDRRGYAPRSKRSPYEGGVRTPIMLSWPGQIQPGTHESLANTVDLAPTVLAACGMTSKDVLPGRDLLAIARGEALAQDTVFGEIFTHDVVDVDQPARSLLYRWVRRDRFKLIVPVDPTEPSQLFDLLADPGEDHDFATAEPAKVRELSLALDRFWAGR